MSERFFIEPPITGDRALLTGSEVHHLAGVMRAKVGDEITLFDGSGSEFTGRIDSLKKDRCELAILQKREHSREPGIAIAAGIALPKGERQKWLVEKLTELASFKGEHPHSALSNHRRRGRPFSQKSDFANEGASFQV